jgi:succinate dehydrogenase flavin-adding protein (antitoxin of CptAB toxin-antitoxin module)
MSDHQAWLKRMRLAARRGNQETDLLLNRYIDYLQTLNHYHQTQVFEQLVTQDDQTLFNWLLNPDNAPGHLISLVKEIRKIYLNSTS